MNNFNNQVELFLHVERKEEIVRGLGNNIYVEVNTSYITMVPFPGQRKAEE